MEQTLGLYLHIPFCKSKCAYCDFYSLPHSEEKMDAYAAALLRHLEEVAPRCTAHTVDTVYFGGGTPSYLGEKRLTHLLKAVKKRFHVAANIANVANTTAQNYYEAHATPTAPATGKPCARCGRRGSTAFRWAFRRRTTTCCAASGEYIRGSRRCRQRRRRGWRGLRI